MSSPLFGNKKLQQIFERIWVSPEGALLDLKEIAKPGKTSITPSGADTQLLQFIVDVLLQRFEELDLRQEKLLHYLTSGRNEEKAALLTVWAMYGWTLIGRLDEAGKIKQHFANTYKPDNCPLAYACYYVFSCVYSEKDGYYEDRVRLAQETETHLQKHPVTPVWQQSLLCQAKLYRSRTHSNYNRLAEAVEAMQLVEKDIQEYGLCSQVYELVLYSYAMHYENFGERTKTIQVLEEAVAISSRRQYSDIAKYTAIANLMNTYGLRNRQLKKNDTEYKTNHERQLQLIDKADKITANSFTTSTTAFYHYAKAGFWLEEGDLQQALQAIAKSILIFYRFGHVRFLAQAYTTAHRIYKTGAIAEADYRMAYRAARCAEQMRTMTDKYYKGVFNRRIESLELQFKIREKELNEKLLQQQIDTMSKEIQLSAINLQEKIQILDEIKTYVKSLKRKELETRYLINTIAKKIDSVKITEEEKVVLQQKMGDTNQAMYQVLREKYPVLSDMEIRMCGLFKTGVTNKELAKLYGQTEKSYEQHRYRIKKKMGLGANDKLVTHLLKMSTH